MTPQTCVKFSQETITTIIGTRLKSEGHIALSQLLNKIVKTTTNQLKYHQSTTIKAMPT